MIEPWLDAFVPVFGLLALGALLRQRLLRDDAIWAGIEKLVFWVLLPSLIATALSGMRLGELPVGRIGLTIWGALLAGTAVALVLARLLRAGHPAMTSILQGGIRFNNLMGFAIAGAIWGQPGLALTALSTGFIVPLVQAISTIAFALGGEGKVRPLRLLRQVLLNPLILACAIALRCRCSAACRTAWGRCCGHSARPRWRSGCSASVRRSVCAAWATGR